MLRDRYMAEVEWSLHPSPSTFPLHANINIDIDGNKVSHYQNIKLLGVNIDSQLTFNDHISEICKKS